MGEISLDLLKPHSIPAIFDESRAVVAEVFICLLFVRPKRVPVVSVISSQPLEQDSHAHVGLAPPNGQDISFTANRLHLLF